MAGRCQWYTHPRHDLRYCDACKENLQAESDQAAEHRGWLDRIVERVRKGRRAKE